MELKEFQVETIEKASRNIRELLVEAEKRRARGNTEMATFVLKSCTGSGKTIMLAEILRELADRDLPGKYVFIWSAPNKLHLQSYKKLSSLLRDTRYKLIDIDELEAGELSENTILFMNWEKVNKIANRDNPEKNIKKGDFTNVAVRRGEFGRNLQDVLDETREAGFQVILIADESHQTFMGSHSQALTREVLQPTLTIEASATPRINPNGASIDVYRRIDVLTDDVKDSGLIKKQALVNYDIEQTANKDGKSRDAIELALLAGLNKRKELKKKYKELGVDINPLMTIQLPSEGSETMSELDMLARDIIEEILNDNGYEYEKGNLAIWLSDEKENLDDIEKIDNKVDVLIFKQAIALGWDCPRAQILVMLRDIKSEAFKIQTIGRIMRMPEAKAYGDDDLDSAFVYTNYSDVDIDESDNDAKNLIKKNKCHIKDEIENIELPDSEYLNRTDYGDLKANFRPVLKAELDAMFGVSDSDNPSVRYKKLDEKLEVYPDELMTPIVSDVVIENVDDEFEKKEIQTIDTKMNEMNVERIFSEILRGYCGKYKNFARSETKIKGTLKPWFKKSKIDWGLAQRILVCSSKNQAVFANVFDRALDKYDTINQKEMHERRQRQGEQFTFTIPVRDAFNENYKLVPMKKNVMDNYYRQDGSSKPEIDFENALDNSDQVEWWYRNGSRTKLKKYFAVTYGIISENGKTRRDSFYPDYIVKFTDGRIGILDTKNGRTATSTDAVQKANALQRYIKDHPKINLFGGLVNVEKGLFYLNSSDDYEYGDGKTGQWSPFIL